MDYRRQLLQRAFDTPSQIVGSNRAKSEVGSDRSILHLRIITCFRHLFCQPLQLFHLPTLIISRHILRQSIVIQTETRVDIHKESVAGCMRPIQTRHQVAPIVFCLIFFSSSLTTLASEISLTIGRRRIANVLAPIEHSRQSVALREAMHQFSVDIIEIHLGIRLHCLLVVVNAFEQRLHYGSEI